MSLKFSNPVKYLSVIFPETPLVVLALLSSFLSDTLIFSKEFLWVLCVCLFVFLHTSFLHFMDKKVILYCQN